MVRSLGALHGENFAALSLDFVLDGILIKRVNLFFVWEESTPKYLDDQTTTCP